MIGSRELVPEPGLPGTRVVRAIEFVSSQIELSSTTWNGRTVIRLAKGSGSH